MTSAAIPSEVGELTREWFSRVLARNVTDATVIDTSSGTTGRARVALRGEPDVPASVFVKLAPFDERQRALVDMTGMGVSEARFYRDLASEVPVLVPGAWFAATEDDRYVMVLEDLVATGTHFPQPSDADIAARARDIVEQLAVLHIHYWQSPRFEAEGDLAWLAARGDQGGDGGNSFIRRAVDAIGDQMDDDFHRIAALYLARSADISQLWRTGPGTLVHGDSHLGNLFVPTQGVIRTGFLDWAVVCKAPGIRDVAYTMCNSVPSDIRAAIERGLIDRYCELLTAAGIAIDPAEVWDQYRIHAVYSWVAAAATAGMGSKWQSLEIGLGGTRRATAACAHLDSVGLLESILS